MATVIKQRDEAETFVSAEKTPQSLFPFQSTISLWWEIQSVSLKCLHFLCEGNPVVFHHLPLCFAHQGHHISLYSDPWTVPSATEVEMVLNSSGSQEDDKSDKQSMHSLVFTVMMLEYIDECLHDVEDCINI